jgi:single-stranded-DNA-specific exonuclease
MEYTWKNKAQFPESEVTAFAEMLNIDKVLATLLFQRNVKTFEEARAFFRPALTDLHDPFLMKDMDKAVERIGLAIQRDEKILVYGDYDVDGTTSVSLVYSFLHKRYSNLGYYIPNRYAEGYGISYKGIDFAVEHGYSLIIALDCGVKAVEKIHYANERNVDFIICDHHTPGDKIPEAVAVLVPKREDCNYPFKELSGCGVGFKLMQAFVLRFESEQIKPSNYNEFGNELPGGLDEMLDLVCVSIASDIVPLVGENRILAFYGLKQLKSNPCIGLKVLKKISGIEENKDITISDIVFKLGPRINAAGRIESGSQSVDLLISQDEVDAIRICSKIDSYNKERKDLDHNITEEALKMIESEEGFGGRKSTILFNPLWHKGVVGIVASRLIDWHYRPTVIMTESNGFATGSARSVEGFDLYNAVNLCSDLLENFGGHKYAAGLTLRRENLTAFKERFERIVADTITDEQQLPQIEVDAVVNFADITPKFYRILKQFAPFGPENMVPVFVTHQVMDTGNSRRVGKEGEHLKLEVLDKNVIFPAIAFSKGNLYDSISQNQFDICYNIDENEFRGNVNLQLFVRDIKV